MFHPTLFAVPTGTQTDRAATLAELTTQLGSAGVTASNLLIAPDDWILITVDTGAQLLATLLALDLEPVDSAGPDRYAKGVWRGMRVIVAYTTRYPALGIGAA